MTDPVSLLFAADRRLRDAATDYHDALFDQAMPASPSAAVSPVEVSEQLVRQREDALRQAALDYAEVAGAVDKFHHSIIVSDDVVARLTRKEG